MTREEFERLLEEEGEQRQSIEWTDKRSLAELVRVRE